MEKITSSEVKREIAKYTIMALAYCRSLGSSKKQRALWKVCDKPMLQWVIEVALASKYIDRMYVATEDREIGKVAEDNGARVIYRPIDDVLDYPQDRSQGIGKMIKPRSLMHQRFVYLGRPWHYSLHYLFDVEGYTPDILLMVLVDCPLTTTKSIDRLIEIYIRDEEANGAIAVSEANPKRFIENPKTGRLFPLFMDAWQGIPRQDYPTVYEDGGIRISGGWTKAWNSEQKHAWIVVPREECLMVHDKEDLFLANYYMKRRLGSGD